MQLNVHTIARHHHGRFYLNLLWLSLLILLLLSSTGIRQAYGAGGDIISPFPLTDTQTGKQEATASVVDPDGNVIVTGYQNLAGDMNDDFYTVKFNGSGVAWRASFNRSGGTDRGVAVAVDSNKDVIVTGVAWNGTNKDIYTIKYNGSTGAVIWEYSFNGGPNADDYPTCITVDSLNNIYVGGYTNAGGNDDYLIIKYSTTGANPDKSPIMKITYNGPANTTDKLTAITAGNGGIAVTGYSSNGTDFDILTLKYDYSGNKLREWRRSSSGTFTDWGEIVKLDSSGNVVVSGFLGSASDKDIYTAKYNGSTGALIWEKTYAGTLGQDDEPADLYVDASGDVFVTGYTATLTEGRNIYTVRYHDPASGTSPDVKWEKTYNSGNTNDDTPIGIIGDSSGNIYVGGYSITGGDYDFLSLKYLNDGTPLWQKSYNSSPGMADDPIGIGLSATDQVYMAGWSQQASGSDYDYTVLKFDPGAINPPSSLAAGTLTKDGTNHYSIPLTWTDNSSNEDGFILERKLGEFGTYSEVSTVPKPLPADSTSYTDTGLDEGNFYFYRIKAVSSINGASHYSNELRVLTQLDTQIGAIWTFLYNGVFDSDDFATAIAVGPDNHPVVTGYSLDYAPGYASGTTSTDFLTFKLNKVSSAIIWKDQFEGGFNQEDDAIGITVDSSNKVYVTGNSFQYPGSGDNINSVFTLKYESSAPATMLWKGHYNGPSKLDDRATSVATATDGSNNIAVVGHGKNNPVNDDIYLIKYPANPGIDGVGNAIPTWTATPYNGSGNDYPAAVAFDSNGDLFITGYTETGSGTNVYTIFTAKYCGTTGSPSCAGKTGGQIIWQDIYPGTGDNRAASLAVGVSGDIFVTGYDTSGGTGRDIITIKYDGKATPSGQRRIWTRIFDNSYHGNDSGASVKVDPIDSNVVVGGTTATDLNNDDFILLRYDTDGNAVWKDSSDLPVYHKVLLRPTKDEHLNAMALDISGNIFVVGHTSNGSSTDSLSAKFSYDGSLIGTTVFNGSANGFDEASAVAVNGLGDAFVAGYSTNGSTGSNGPNADYLVYKVAGVPLQAPSPFTATANYTSAILAWTDNASVEDGYHLERKIGSCSSANPWAPLAVSPLAANVTTYTDINLTIGQLYCYRVRAFRANGEVTRWIERPVLMQIPPAPTTFAATAPDTTTVNLTWTDATTNETGFQIERCTGNGCDFSSLDSGFPKFAAENATSYSDTSACSNTTFRYRILAYKTNVSGTGNEWESGYTTLSTPVSGAITTPAATVPGGIGISALNESQIRVTWTNIGKDETGYRIYECTVADCSTTSLVGSAAATANNYTVYGLLPGSTHKYQVTAYKTVASSCNGGWESAASVPVSASTVNNPPTLTVTKVNTTQLNLSWTDPTASGTGFELQKCTNGVCSQDADFSPLSSPGQHVTAYSDMVVCQGSTNKYRVRAINDGLSLRGTVASNWAKKAPVTITPATFQSFYQTKVIVTKASFPEMKADYSDIRFYDDTAKMELSYWLDPNLTTPSAATVWVKTGPFNTISMYYGNPDATSANNGAGTFDFFDDFTGTALGTAWTKSTSGSPVVTIAGGTLTLDAPSTANVTVSKGLALPYQLEARINNLSAPYLNAGLIRSRVLFSGVPVDAGIFDVGGGYLQVYYNGLTGKQVPADQYVRVRAAHTGGATNSWSVHKEDGTQIHTVTYTGTPAGISLSEGDTGGGSGKIVVDWVYARKYAVTEPSVSIGTPVNWGSTFSDTWTGTWSIVQPNPSFAVDAAAIPTLQAAVRISETEIKVTWKNNTTDETGTKIDRCTVSDCSSIEQTFTVGPGIQILNDNTGLLPNTTYYYRIHGYKTATCSWDVPAATIVSATTTLLTPNNPGATPSVTTTCNDLRFTDSDGTTLLSYNVESGCNTNNTKLHVKVPSIASGTKQLYLYYGFPAATAGSAGEATFDFFDDFSGSAIDGSKWTITDGTGFSVASGYLHGTNTTGRLTSKVTLAAGQNVQAKVKVGTLPGNGVITLGAFTNSGLNIGWLNHPGFLYYINNGAYTQNPTTPPAGSAQSDWIIYSLTVKDGSTVGLSSYDTDLGANYWIPADLANAAVGRPFVLGRRYDSDGYNNQGYAADWDWVRIRKYANPAPYFSLLSPEEYGSYNLTGGTWAVRRPLTVTHSGSTVNNFQVTTYVDTTSLASDQVALSWTSRTVSETGFVVERCSAGVKTNPDCDFSSPDPPFSSPAGSTSYLDRTVAPNSKYCYRVKAERTSAPAWTTGTTTAVCAVTSDIPAKPTLTVTPHVTSMDLSWNDTATGENAWIVQRCKGVGCNINSPDQTFTLTPNLTSYTDSTVCNDTYTYRVKPAKYGPNAWSISFSDPGTQATVSPGTPVLLSATRVSDSQINLAWQDNTSDEDGFEIDRCEGQFCDFFTKTTFVTAASVTSYSDTALKPNTLYRYRVRAYKSGGSCGWPSAYSTDVREATTTVSAPTGTSATASNTTQANISWTDTTSNESGFNIFRCKDAGCTPVTDIFAGVGTDATSFSDAGVCPGSLYNYQVKAVNTVATFSNAGSGCWSSRAALSITNFQPNFLTRFTITKDADMKADFSDLRFYDVAELPYWLESSTAGSATVWVKTGTKNNIYVYFGNANATSSSSMAGVFGSGLVGYWPFNNAAGTTSGTTLDVSGKGNDLSLTNFSGIYGVVAGGVFGGNALSLNGSNNYAKKDTPASLPTGGIASVEAWIYPKAYADATYNGIVSFGPRSTAGASLLMSIQNSGRPSMATWGNDFIPGTGATATINAWNHIAVVLDGSTTATLYLNGQAVSGAMSGGITPNLLPQNLAIGITDYPGRYFNGMIDEVRIYNRALTAQEISGRYAATLPTVAMQTKEKPGGCITLPYQFDGPLSSSFTVVTPSIGNLVVNSDFENGLTNWTPGTGGSSDTTISFSGSKSLKVTGTLAKNSGLNATQILPALIPGGNYLLTGYMRASLHNGFAYCRLDSGSGNPAATWTEFDLNYDPSAYMWKKYDNSIQAASDTTGTNGRIPLGSTAGVGDIGSVQSQAIIVDDGPTYKMWYSGNSNGTSGNWRVFYATSADGGLTWTKQDNTIEAPSDTTGTNGRIPLGNSGRGDSNHTYISQSVIKDGSTYKMWYSGQDGTYWRIYYATSVDGLTWTKYDNTVPAASDTTGTNGRVPLGTAGKGDSNGAFGPTVIKDGSTYKLWYTGIDGSSVGRTYYATSPDGLTWSKYDNTVPSVSDGSSTNGRIPLGNSGKGDSAHARFAHVMKDGSLYRMWYAGSDGSSWRVYYASSPDGLTWTKYDNTTPAVSDSTSTTGRIPIGSAGRSDSNGALAPTVIKNGSMYQIWYAGFDGSSMRRILYATLNNPVWNKYDNSIPASSNITSTNGRLPLGLSGTGDSRYVGGQSVILDGATYKMWYSGHDGTNWRIYYATSADGLTWTKYDNSIPAISDGSSTNGRIPIGGSGKGDSLHAAYLSVIKDGATYKMWYSGHDGTNMRIFYATSADGLTWTKYDNTIPANSDTTSSNGRIPWGSSGKGDSSQVRAGAGSVILDGATYKMWYSGYDGTSWRIYYATSPDGLAWTKYDNTIPANSDTTGTNGRLPLGSSGKGDSAGVVYPYVMKDGSVYKMWYSGSDGTSWRIYYATSADGLTWTKYDNTLPVTSDSSTGNGRVALGNGGMGDSSHVFVPSVIKNGSTYTMWYMGYDPAGSGYYRVYSATLSANDYVNDQQWHAFSLPITLSGSTTGVNLSVICGLWRATADANPDGVDTAWFDMIQLVQNPVINLTVTRSSEAQINLVWSDGISDKSGYRVERCNLGSCSDGDFFQIGGDLSSAATTLMDIVPTPGITYTYRVKAFKTATCNWSVLSNTGSATASFSTPTALTATAVNTTRIDLGWTYPSASETGFIIERCTGASCSGTDFQPLPVKAGPGATSYTDTTVCNNTTYRYQIKAYKDGLSQGDAGCWTRRKDITVANNTPAAQVRFTVTWDSDMKPDFSDLRFYDDTAKMELPHWIESKTNSSSAVVWVKTGSTNTIQMYFKNADAVSTSNGNRVFDFFDDFTGTTIDSAKWTEVDTGANYITQNNGLVVNGGSSSWNTGIYTKANFTRPFVFESTVMTTNYYHMMIGAKNTGAGYNYTDYTYATYYINWGPDIFVYEDGSNRGDTGLDIANSTWKYLRLEVLPTGAKYYSGDTIAAFAPYYTSSYSTASPLKVGFVNYNKYFNIGNMRVRRYIPVEPTVSAISTKFLLGSCATFSGQWTGNLNATPAAATTPAWARPTGLVISAASDTLLNVSWTDTTSDESSFSVERCQGSGCTPSAMTPAVSVGANITAYSDTTGTGSSTFCYRVRASKTATCGWDSDYSDTACDLSFPVTTGNLTAVPINSRAVHLSWTDAAIDEEGYEVEIQTWNGLWAPISRVLGSHVTSFDHAEGLEPGRQYSYRIRPFRGTDRSPYSNVATVTLPSFASSPPTCP